MRTKRQPITLHTLLIMSLFYPFVATGNEADRTPCEVSQARGFSVYALSRGMGVPAKTRGAFNQVMQLLNDMKDHGGVVSMATKRIGLEGETRLCIEFSDGETAREAFQQAKEIGKGIELLNFEAGLCAQGPGE